MGWIQIAIGIALLVAAALIYIVTRRRQEPLCPEPWTEPEQYSRVAVSLCNETDEPLTKVSDVSGLSISMDYDPERDGEFDGPPGLLSALAALRFGGVVLMSEQDDGSWLIRGSNDVEGRGDTPSQAYGDLLNQMKQNLN